MTVARIRPATVDGTVDAPASKSYTHRFVLAAHLSGRPGHVRRPLVSDDTLRTARAVRQLGSRVTLGRSAWTVRPGGGATGRRTRVIDCGESGTTLRLLSAAAALRDQPYRFVGRGRLPRRPIAPLLKVLRRLGATIVPAPPGDGLPLELRGPIHGGTVEVPADESSQFTSALLFALPTVVPGSRLRTVGTPVSEPYVRASVAVLRAQGVTVAPVRHGYAIPGGQRFRPVDATVPGDASSAAYLWAAAAVSGGRTSVRGVPTTWPQADLAVLDLLRRYGAAVSRSGATTTVRGERRRPFRVRLTDAPDLYPLAGVLAATAHGRSYLLGAEHVVAKESDRKLGTARLVRAMGARVTEVNGGLAVDGVSRPRPVRLRGAHDHRIVMSAAVAAAASDRPSELADAAAVAKSFPRFFDVLGRLGLEVTVR
ncbi:MAG TPA: 3-phosphoshikimate 1-carboxyvinyltransferase [Thermoplasmata archaeon]|nr:3-phosphoshikimate 1-carboxyvinyltransferase [Thermoplasmata archaeon]